MVPYTLTEGQSTNRPPFFNGVNYSYWKERMRIFIQSTDYDLWKIIINGPDTPMTTNDEGQRVPKTDEEWTPEEKKKVEMNAKAINLMHCAISFEEYRKVSRCKSAKEIWDKLQLTHEGTKQIKQTKTDMLMREYELFCMKDDENIDEMFERFAVIINNLDMMGKSFEDEELVRKILRSLTNPWLSKTTAIQEGRDISTLTYDELRGNLIAFETTHLKNDKKKKGLALKSRVEDENNSDMEEELPDDDEFSLFAQRMMKLWNKRNRIKKGSTSKKESKKEISKKDVTCHYCKQPGHFKNECPLLQKKEEGRKSKKKGLLSTWEDLENDSSDDEDEEENVAHLCLMANHEDEVEFSDLSHDDLLDIIDDLLVNSKNMLSKYSAIKKENELLNVENTFLKSEIETLKGCFSKSFSCDLKSENDMLHQKVESLTQDLAKFVQGSKNLEKLMGQQRCAINKAGLGYHEHDQNRFYKNLFDQPSTSSTKKIYDKPYMKHFVRGSSSKTKLQIPEQCYNCNGKGHLSNECYIFWKPDGNRHIPVLAKVNAAGIPRGTNFSGSKKLWIPKRT